MKDRFKTNAGFTLVELVVVASVVLVLGASLYGGFTKWQDQARNVQCIANLRSLATGALNWASERNGRLWTREQLGYSYYRQKGDPYGLPEILKDYVPNERVWWCPAGRPATKIFGNSYVMNAAKALEEESIYTMNTKRTLLFWDNYIYTLPSVFNRVDSQAPLMGPKSPGTRYQRKPHAGLASVNWVFLDGHVVSGPTAAQD